MSKSRKTIIIERTMLILVSSTVAVSGMTAYENGDLIALALMSGMWVFVLALAAASA